MGRSLACLLAVVLAGQCSSKTTARSSGQVRAVLQDNGYSGVVVAIEPSLAVNTEDQQSVVDAIKVRIYL